MWKVWLLVGVISICQFTAKVTVETVDFEHNFYPNNIITSWIIITLCCCLWLWHCDNDPERKELNQLVSDLNHDGIQFMFCVQFSSKSRIPREIAVRIPNVHDIDSTNSVFSIVVVRANSLQFAVSHSYVSGRISRNPGGWWWLVG